MAEFPWTLPPGYWDNPQPCTAPTPDVVDAVSLLNRLRDRLPTLIGELQRAEQAIPDLLLQALTGEITPDRWLLLAALCDGPGETMKTLAELCREQAETGERRQIEGEQ